MNMCGNELLAHVFNLFIFYIKEVLHIKSKFNILSFSFSEFEQESRGVLPSLILKFPFSENRIFLSQGGLLATKSCFFWEVMGSKRGSWRFGVSKVRVYSKPPFLSLATPTWGVISRPMRPSRFKSSIIFACSVIFFMLFCFKFTGQIGSLIFFIFRISESPRDENP